MSPSLADPEGPERPRGRARVLILGLLLLVAAVSLAACGSSGSSSGATETSEASDGGGTETTAEEGEGGGAGEPVNLSFVAWATNNGYSQATFKGIEKKSKELGAGAEIQNGAIEPPKQLSLVQDGATSGKYQGIIVQPLDGPGIASAVEEAVEAGVKVVSVFGPVGPSFSEMKPQVPGMTAVVGTAVAESGRGMGEMAIEACGSGPCEVAYLSGRGSDPQETVRTEAFEEALAKDPQANLVTVQEAPPPVSEGLKVGQNVLAAHPDVDVLAANSDQVATGAVQAAKEAGSKVKIIGNGGSIEGIEAIHNGEMFGTFLDLPETEGEIAAELAIKAARGEEVEESVSPGEQFGESLNATAKTVGSFKGQWHVE